MANTSARTLRLLSLLQGRRHWPGAELARQLEVSPRTLRRDVDRLRELGYPIQAQRGAEGGYQLAAGTALPPLLVDDEEAVALAVALQAAAHGSVEGIAESSVRALAKVAAVMPARLRRRVEALGAMTVPATWGDTAGASANPGVLTSVAVACRDAERLRFSYTAADGRHSDRHVEPHRLVLLGRRWYLVGYDLARHDWRSFRLDRLTAPAATGTRFRPRELPAADAAAFVRAGIKNLGPVYRVEFLVDAPAPAVRERIGRWSVVEDIGASRCRVRMTTDSLDWPVIALGGLAADFQVVSPAELLDRVRDWGRRFSQAAMRLFLAEAVEFAVLHTAEECVPLIRREPEDRPGAVAAVAHANPAVWQARYLDAVTVGEAQGALHPVRTRRLASISEGRSFHVCTPLNVIGACRNCNYLP